jgi:cold shock CspA family protein
MTARAHTRQATVHVFDADTGDGSVIGDDGVVLPFTSDAWVTGRLRTLRPGQRVRLVLEGGVVTTLTLATFPLPERARTHEDPGPIG